MEGSEYRQRRTAADGRKRQQATGGWYSESKAACWTGPGTCYAGYDGRTKEEPDSQGVSPAAEAVVRGTGAGGKRGQHVSAGIASDHEPPDNENRHRQDRNRGSHGESGSQTKA
jgi:hypothetical protein